ncbi:Golgi apparatus membrane TVP15 [Micractinium conductrix]|uniref:Golgi apparatus membrane TVP15 n=1 Tax=Micractinium conductrix TaxID=554055 RepID=A0A2P6V0J3_9CHLO|nr:Golgi apparatus membrane TVP15 [Micractinium conductrix]|eukprot:PSC67616.1 Golgi apparatus membrane TVP15 [Micractinium conductrix]
MNDRAELLPFGGPGVGSSSAPLGGPPHRGHDCLLSFCRAFNFVTGLCAVLCALAFGMAMWVRGEAPTKDPYFYSGQAVRLFGIGIAGMVLLVETEWRRWLELVPLLESWLGRGVLQIFEATLTFREAYPSGSTDFHKSLALYRSAASLSLLVCGSVYILGTVTCIGVIKTAKQRQEATLARAEAELERMERRKKELERQLGLGLPGRGGLPRD